MRAVPGENGRRGARGRRPCGGVATATPARGAAPTMAAGEAAAGGGGWHGGGGGGRRGWRRRRLGRGWRGGGWGGGWRGGGWGGGWGRRLLGRRMGRRLGLSGVGLGPAGAWWRPRVVVGEITPSRGRLLGYPQGLVAAGRPWPLPRPHLVNVCQ